MYNRDDNRPAGDQWRRTHRSEAELQRLIHAIATPRHARALPGATKEVIAPARHFTALLPCKPEGPAILRADGDGPVCDDPEGTDRNAVHRRIMFLVAAQLGLVDGV